MKNKIYIAKYSIGEHTYYEEISQFASTDKDIVLNWCKKYNDILNKWKNYHENYFLKLIESKNKKEIKDYYERSIWVRRDILSKINKAYYEEIEIR